MASQQVDSSPVEDVITETEGTGKEPQAVVPPPPAAAAESDKTVDVEDEEGDLEDLTVPPYEGKVENSDEEEEKEREYSFFMEREDAAPFTAGEPRTIGQFNEDEYEEFDEED